MLATVLPYDAHTMEQKAIVASSSQKAKSFKDFNRAYRFVRNDPIFKDYTWWTQQPNTMLETLLARRGENGDTLLHYAARKNDMKAAKRLLRRGLAFNIDNDAYETPEDVAAELNKERVHQFLKAHNELFFLPSLEDWENEEIDQEILEKYEECDEPLLLPSLEDLEKLLQLKVCLNVRDGEGYTPLLRIACIHSEEKDGDDDMKIIEKLLDAKASVHVQSPDGDTPLHHAAYCGNSKTVALLIKAQACVDTQNQLQETPMHNLMKSPHNRKQKKKITKLLLGAQADIRTEDSEGQTALDLARKKKLGVIIALLEQAEQKQKQS